MVGQSKALGPERRGKVLRQLLECASPLALWGWAVEMARGLGGRCVRKGKRQGTAAVQDASRGRRAPVFWRIGLEPALPEGARPGCR